MQDELQQLDASSKLIVSLNWHHLL